MGEKFAWATQIGVAAVAVVVVWLFVGAAAIPVAAALCAFGIFEAYMEHRKKRAKEEQNNQLREGNPFISERTRPWYL